MIRLLVAFILLFTCSSIPSKKTDANLNIKIVLLPELTEFFKHQPIKVEIAYGEITRDTTVINNYQVHFSGIPSDYVWIRLFSSIKCSDSLTKKWYYSFGRISMPKSGNADTTVLFPPDCPRSKYTAGKICPICKKMDKVIPIHYGLPSFDTPGTLGVDYEVASCLHDVCAPDWHCKRDNKDF